MFATIYKQATINNDVEVAFIGEHDEYGCPDGFVRTINPYGSIFEGVITPNGKMNGFCI